MTARRSWRIWRIARLAIGGLLVVLAAPMPAGGQNAGPTPNPTDVLHAPAEAVKPLEAATENQSDSEAAPTQDADSAASTSPAASITGEPVSSTAPADPDEEPVPDIKVSPQGRVEMHVRDLNLASVLQMLSMQSQRNIIASKDVSGKVTANLYNVTFEEALTAILDANAAGWREQGNFVYVYTKDEMRQMEVAAKPRVTRLFRLKYIRAADAKELLAPLLSTEAKITVTPPSEKGIAASSDGAGGDTLSNEDALLIVDYPDRLESVASMLADLDVRPKQVMVEATILRAQLNEDNAMGIDFSMVGGVDFQNVSSVSDPAVTNLTVGALPAKDLQKTTVGVNTDFTNAVPKGGFTFGIIHNNVAMFIRALEQVTDTTVLANPKILTLNKQHGEVMVGRRDGYLTTTVTETSAVQNVQFLETGTQLRFRPFVGDDGYIRMEVHPEDSTGGLTAANLPFESTTEVTTNIIVRDGHTILIGGLFREVTTSGREQLPIAGNLPIAGALFRNNKDNTQREEVIILLTVHLVKEPDCLAESGEKIANDVERFRVGMRRGLQWYGRERLAQAHYHWALQHLEKGHLSQALWDLDLAINNNPKFMAAVKLKEQLIDKREWDDEGSELRNFVAQEVARESGLPAPIFGRPGPPFSFLPLEGPNGFDDGEVPSSEHDKSSSPSKSPSGQGAS